MTHPVEIWTTDGVSFTPTYKRLNPTGDWGGDYTFTGPNSVYGSIASRGRDASHHNAKVDGWREPSDYWAHDIRHVIPKPVLHRPYSDTLAYEVDDVLPLSLVSTSFPDLSADLEKTRSKGLKKLGDMKVDFSVAFAERQKTVDMVADNARRLARDLQRGLNSLPGRRGRSTGARPDGSRRRRASDVWLEARYGWSPLLMDLEGAINWLDSRDNGSYARYRVRSKVKTARRTFTPFGSWNETYLGRYYTIPARYRDAFTEKTEVTGVYFASIKDGTFLSLAQCGLTNPLNTAWELVPYSFVVDWFIGVGDYLSNIWALDGLSWCGGSETRFVSRTAEREWTTSVENSWPFVTGIEGQRSRSSYRAFVRAACLGPPGNALIVKEHPWSTLHMIDAISLLAGFIPGARSPRIRTLVGGH